MKLKLFPPEDKRDVGLCDLMFGVISPVTADTQVQLYVMAGDGLWHLQPATAMIGKTFLGNCYFGNEETLHKPGQYKVIAVVTKERPKSPAATLPEGKKSNMVVVRRCAS